MMRLVLVLAVTSVLGHKKCEWNDGAGHIFDLSALGRSKAYQIIDENNSKEGGLR